MRVLDVGDGIAHKLPSCQENPAVAEFIRRLSHCFPHSRPSAILESHRSTVRAVASVRILKFAGPLGGGREKGDDKKDSNLKDARMSGYRPCVHSICRRLRDPSHSLFLSVYLSLVTRIHRSYDRRALTPSVTRALCEKILYKKIEPRYSFSIM